MNPNLDLSKEYIVKLMLKEIIEIYSLKEIINDVIFLVERKEGELKLKDKIPLTSRDIISIIHSSIGSIQLLQWLIELNTELELEKMRKKRTKKKIKKLKEEENKILTPKFKKQESVNDKEKEYDKAENAFYSNCDIPLNLDRNNDEFVIEIKNGNEILNSTIINLDESDSSNSEQNDNYYGVKSEIKSPKRKNNLSKGFGNGTFSNRNGINSETKIFNDMKKARKNIENSLNYHYHLKDGKVYKYKFDKLNEKGNIAEFSCADPNCFSCADYEIKTKVFDIIASHSLAYEDHCYVKINADNDYYIFDKMQNENISDMQLKKK